MDKKIISILLTTFITIILSSLIICIGLFNVVKEERTVTVRGLSEREVYADLVIWPLKFTTGSNNLSSLQEDIIYKTKVVTDFLKEYSLTEDDFTVLAPDITDYSVDPYINRSSIPYNFLAKTTVLIRTSKVELVKKAQSDSLVLAGRGIAVSHDYDSKITYEFTKLNEIKPEMIAEATKNARKVAEQFAHDSNSKVGKIKKASQGLFSIEDAAQGLEEKKNIRVVTSVEYSLK